MADPTPDEMLADDIAGYYADPLGYVLYVFPFDTDKSIQLVDWYDQNKLELLWPKGRRKNVWEIMEKWRKRFPKVKYGPDWWACEFLDELGEDIKQRNFDGRTAVDPMQYVTTSGHGIGKSVLVAWLIKFIMDTRPYAKGVVTANTDSQLRTKTWAEVGKWHKISLTSHWFDYNTGRGAMSLAHKQHKETWRCDAQTCKEENSEAFAGLHAANSTPFYIFDEAAAIPDKIYEVREGGTTDGEPMTFDFGNPTRNSGRFFEECEGRFKHRYRMRRIDSRACYIANSNRIEQWVEDYGEDSDFVKVRVRGEFPSSGSAQFMPTNDVDGAMVRPTPVQDSRLAPLILGVDVGRFGDDETVIYPRIGDDARSFAPIPGDGRYRGLDTVQVVGKVIEKVQYFHSLGKTVAAIFVDGGGIGAGVVDQLRALGYNVFEVQFGGGATDKDTYRFKSDEMWGNLRKALKGRLVLPQQTHPSGVDLKTQLTQREFGYTLAGNKIHLETKADMKSRLGGETSSPDIADALALTYAQEVQAIAEELAGSGNAQHVKSEYDPLEATN